MGLRADCTQSLIENFHVECSTNWPIMPWDAKVAACSTMSLQVSESKEAMVMPNQTTNRQGSAKVGKGNKARPCRGRIRKRARRVCPLSKQSAEHALSFAADHIVTPVKLKMIAQY